MRRKRMAVALGLALAWAAVLATAYHFVEGASFVVAFIVWIPAGLIFMTPAFYFGRPNGWVNKLVARGIRRGSPPH